MHNKGPGTTNCHAPLQLLNMGRAIRSFFVCNNLDIYIEPLYLLSNSEGLSMGIMGTLMTKIGIFKDNPILACIYLR